MVKNQKLQENVLSVTNLVCSFYTNSNCYMVMYNSLYYFQDMLQKIAILMKRVL